MANRVLAIGNVPENDALQDLIGPCTVTRIDTMNKAFTVLSALQFDSIVVSRDLLHGDAYAALNHSGGSAKVLVIDHHDDTGERPITATTLPPTTEEVELYVQALNRLAVTLTRMMERLTALEKSHDESRSHFTSMMREIAGRNAILDAVQRHYAALQREAEERTALEKKRLEREEEAAHENQMRWGKVFDDGRAAIVRLSASPLVTVPFGAVALALAQAIASYLGVPLPMAPWGSP